MNFIRAGVHIEFLYNIYDSGSRAHTSYIRRVRTLNCPSRRGRGVQRLIRHRRRRRRRVTPSSALPAHALGAGAGTVDVITVRGLYIKRGALPPTHSLTRSRSAHARRPLSTAFRYRQSVLFVSQSRQHAYAP
ncbi:hypothetical protein EVAR_31055_1 [Eumeta japonica]|uniref:Uncharacterized protein n=1 Tax=Eumeta variegata TaxID=151549 RepID=A0A4C1VFI9_EUMVA|nr:hypothetical protein EVAR_31055_1 [Eumeta japonica]